MKQGEVFEKIVQIIQESFKDNPNTVIHKGYKIRNIDGSKREIDILIESIVNGIELKIAIECKDYSKKVSVEKIEAFKGKCDRIPQINKKLFVAKEGYQADAIKAAKHFGITLMQLKDVNIEEFKSWIIPLFTETIINYICNYIRFEFVSPKPEILNFEDSIFFKETDERLSIKEFVSKLREKELNFVILPFKEGQNSLQFELSGEFIKETYLESLKLKKSYRLKKFWVAIELQREDLEFESRYSRYSLLDDNKTKVELATTISKDQNQRMISLVKKEDKEEIEIYLSSNTESPLKFAEVKVERIKKDDS